jgi:hypothetical protein
MAYKNKENCQANIVKAENGFIVNVYHTEMEDGEIPRILVANTLLDALDLAKESLENK